MTPYYLSAAKPEELNIEEEAHFHIRMLKILSLYFDKIFIPIENTISFSNSRNMLVVQRVILSKSFKQMLELGIVSFCGWGANDPKAMFEKGVSYAHKEYEHLKPDSYVKELEKLAIVGDFYSRDNSRFDIGHDRFLKKNLSLLDNANSRQQLDDGLEFIEQFYQSFRYIGSLEFYAWLDSRDLSNELASGFYKAYYRAWQEYCYTTYAPVITVNSHRIRYSYGNINVGTQEAPNDVIALLYSPSIFLRFLEWQLGRRVTRILLNLSPAHIQSIRNGDGAWHRFMEKYHSCIEVASDLHSLETEMWSLRREFSDDRVNALIEMIFKRSVHKINSKAIVDIVSMLSIPIAWALQFFNPAAIFAFILRHFFKKTASAPFAKDAIPFYKKAISLTKSAPIISAI